MNWLVGFGGPRIVSWESFDKDNTARTNLLNTYKLNNYSAVLAMCKNANVPSMQKMSYAGIGHVANFHSHIGWISSWTGRITGDTQGGKQNLTLWRTEKCPCLVEVDVKITADDIADF